MHRILEFVGKFALVVELTQLARCGPGCAEHGSTSDHGWRKITLRTTPPTIPQPSPRRVLSDRSPSELQARRCLRLTTMTPSILTVRPSSTDLRSSYAARAASVSSKSATAGVCAIRYGCGIYGQFGVVGGRGGLVVRHA